MAFSYSVNMANSTGAAVQAPDGASLNNSTNRTVSSLTPELAAWYAATSTRLGLVPTVTLNVDAVSVSTGDSTGTPGNATLNTSAGLSKFASSQSSLVITNSLCATTSRVFAVLQASDATLTSILRVVPGSGSFTIVGNAAATGSVQVAWELRN